MSICSVVLVDKYGGTIATLESAVVQEVVWKLNQPDTAQFTIPTLSPEAMYLALMKTEVQIWIGNVLYFWGIPVTLQGNHQSLSIGCEGLLAWFKYRFITNTSYVYTSIDQMSIAGNLVASLQTGTNMSKNIGVASFTPSGVTRSRQYNLQDHAMLLDLLNEFPTLNNGFDFSIEITPTTRLFTPWYPRKGSLKPNYTLEWGKNIQNFTYSEDGTKTATLAYCTGGTSGGTKFENHYEDTAASNNYDVLQTVFSDGNEQDTSWLLAKAIQEVNGRNHPTITPVVTAVQSPDVLLGNLIVGDSVPVYINCGRVYVPGLTYRIVQAKWTPDGLINYSLVLPPASFTYPPPL